MKSHVDLKWTSQQGIFGNKFIKYWAIILLPAKNGTSGKGQICIGDSDVPNKPQVLQF